MADNVAITAGSGTTISTEEVTNLNGGAVSAQHVQRVIPAARTADATAVDWSFDEDGWSAPLVVAADAVGAADGLSNATIGGIMVETADGSAVPLMTAPTVYNGSTWDRQRGDATNGLYTQVRGAAGAAEVGTIADGTSAAPGLVTKSFLEVYNGSTYDRARGDTTNGLDVDVTRLPALAAGMNNIGDVDIASAPTGTSSITMQGAAAHAAPAVGNPVYVAGRSSAVIPTDVGADGDAAAMWVNRNGATVVLMAPHVGLNSDPWNLLHEGVRYTSAQTSTVVVAGGASEKIVVTKVQLQTEGTTAGTAILYFGTGAFSRGTSRAIFDGNFIPSTTSAPGVVMDGPFIAGTNGDDLLFTSVGAITIVVNVWYYVIT
jgi:hypothetical protein